MAIRVALIGATGNVGRKTASMLLKRLIVSAENLSLFASAKSAGKILSIADYSFLVKSVDDLDFQQYELCIFNTDGDVSEKYIPRAIESGCYVIDSSSSYRLVDTVPLIVPPVNKHVIQLSNSKLYSHANCLASPIATIIAPLHNNCEINRIVASTYQSTSGAGKVALDELINETRNIIDGKIYERQYFDRQISFNIIPKIGEIMNNGDTFEEFKIINEIKKIVDKKIAITITSVRVPVIIGHSISLNIEFRKNIELEEIKNILNTAQSVIYQGQDHYSTPIEVVDSDDVHVGRVRKDDSLPNAINLWIASDNLRRGAATDSVEIAQELITHKIK